MLDPVFPQPFLSPTEEHFLALGRYVSKWGELEAIVNQIVSTIITLAGDGSGGSSPGLTTIVANLSVRDKIDAGNTILEDDWSNRRLKSSAGALSKFLSAVKKSSQRRNRIIHGLWISRNGKEVVRVASGLGPADMFRTLPGSPTFDQRSAARDVFTLARIASEITRLEALVRIGISMSFQCSHAAMRARWPEQSSEGS